MSSIRSWCRGVLASCVVLTGVGLVSAQEPPRGPVRVDRDRVPAGGEARADTGARRATELIGAKVMLANNTEAGTIEDIVFSDDGYVDYFVVSSEGKYVLVPWGASKVDYHARSVVLDIPVEKYREVPTFTRESWPNVYDPQYRQRIYTYYGVSPRVGAPVQERRNDRREDRHDEKREDRRDR